MTDIIDSITQLLDIERVKIVDKLAGKNINASGRTSTGFAVRVDNEGVKLIYSMTDSGGAPFATLERGRRPGKIPMGFVAIIEGWAKDKGLSFSSDKELRRFAGAVAFGKIKERGFGRPAPSDYGSEDNTVRPSEDDIQQLKDNITLIAGNAVRAAVTSYNR